MSSVENRTKTLPNGMRVQLWAYKLTKPSAVKGWWHPSDAPTVMRWSWAEIDANGVVQMHAPHGPFESEGDAISDAIKSTS